MKKKILIISIISILCIAIIIGYCISKNKISKVQVSEDLIFENDLLSMEVSDDIENIEETSNSIVEDEINEEKSNVEENSQVGEIETSIQPQITQTKTSSNTNNKTESKSEVVKETTVIKEETAKVDIPSTVSEQKQETKVVETPTRCTNNNNHSMEVGNSGQWFSSKSEAIAYYNSQVSYWGNLWETGAIDDATYYKKCPSGYEVWDCVNCLKWTINFYYR